MLEGNRSRQVSEQDKRSSFVRAGATSTGARRPDFIDMRFQNPGFGLGLRTVHYEDILASQPRVDWFEALSENYMVRGGKPLYYLDRIRADYPVVLHGVSLSIGSTDALDTDYLKELKTLADRVQPAWVSDHLCWTGYAGKNIHDLLPLPYTAEAVSHVSNRLHQVQDYLQRPILIENVSSYVNFERSEMSEWEFLGELTRRTDCLLLLDVNNVYVSGFNHGFDPRGFIDALPGERVQQIHLAGHSHCGTHIIDTHDGHVVDQVWALYRLAYQLTDGVSTLLEWDANVPEFEVLEAELIKARNHARAKDVGETKTAATPTTPSARAVSNPIHPLSAEVACGERQIAG